MIYQAAITLRADSEKEAEKLLNGIPFIESIDEIEEIAEDDNEDEEVEEEK